MSAYRRLCTEFYDLTKPFATGPELDFYKDNLEKNSLILEPMCGTGRLLIPLIQAGLTVHGVDNSKEMLEKCKDRIEKLKLPKTELYEMSIETMQLPNQYDAILIPFGSFQLFHPRIQAYEALKNLKKHLKPKGKLFLDLFIPWEALYLNPDESFKKEISSGENEIIKHEGCNKINKYEQYITGTSVYTKIADGKVILTEDEILTVAWYYPYEMELILEKFGFTNIRFDRINLNQEEGLRFIAEA